MNYIQYMQNGQTVSFQQPTTESHVEIDPIQRQKNYDWYMSELNRVGRGAFTAEDASRWANQFAKERIWHLPEVTVTAPKTSQKSYKQQIVNLINNFYESKYPITTIEQAQDYMENNLDWAGHSDADMYHEIQKQFGIDNIPSISDFEEPNSEGYYDETTYALAEQKWKNSLTPQQKAFLEYYPSARKQAVNSALMRASKLTEIPKLEQQYQDNLSLLNNDNSKYSQQKQWLHNWFINRLPKLYGGADSNDAHIVRNWYRTKKNIVDNLANLPIFNLENYSTKASEQQKAHIDDELLSQQYGYSTKAGAWYAPYNSTYQSTPYIMMLQEDPPTYIHEATHALDAPHVLDIGSDWIPGSEYKHSNIPIVKPDYDLDIEYKDNTKEPHARLMQARYELNLDPLKTDYNLAWLHSPHVQAVLKKYQLDRYTDDQLLHMFNTWASNTTNPFEVSNDTYLAAFGGKLNRYNYFTHFR